MSPTSTYITCAILGIFITLSKGDQGQAEAYSEDAKEILLGPVYHWKNWCFCKDIYDLHVWSEAAVLEFWKSSTFGYVLFVIDGKSMTINSNGSLENDTNPQYVLEKVSTKIKLANYTQPILSHAGSMELIVEKWLLVSRKEGEMTIRHRNRQQVITLQEDFSGFTSQSDGKKQTFWANISMGAEFSTSWITNRKTIQLRPKTEASKPEIRMPKAEASKPEIRMPKAEASKPEGDQGQAEAYSEDAKEILLGPVYHWKDWCFCEDIYDLHVWSEAAVLELWKSSILGYVLFIIDGKSVIIHPGGRLENDYNPQFILDKVRKKIKSGNYTQPILSHAGSIELVVGNWSLVSRKEGEMTIQHRNRQQAIILQEDFSGFTSESDGKKQTFWANISMGAEFSTSWIPGRKTIQLRPKAEASKPEILMPKVEASKPEDEHEPKYTNCSTLNRNNSESGLTGIQCDTKSHLHNITFLWNIDCFDLHSPVNNEKIVIRSPSFTSATYDKVKWYLKIDPGNKASDKISLFLYRCPNSKETRARAKYSVSFLDSKRNLISTRTLESFYTFNAESGWGWYNIPINEVVSPDNTLNIVCKIAICEFTTNLFYLNRTDITENHENIRSQDFVSSTKNSKTSDVVLAFSKTGKEYPANKTTLAVSSPVFAAMVNISHTENGKKIDRVNITDV